MTRRIGFAAFRARYVVAIWILGAFWLPGFDALIDAIDIDWTHVSVEVAGYYYAHALFGGVLALGLLVWRCPWPALVGGLPGRGDFVAGVHLTAFVFLFSVFAAYLVFYPLSYVAPDFVVDWYIEAPDIVLYDQIRQHYPVWPNVFSAISLCIVAPILEEFAFRGALLHRWAHKWGLKPAVVVSSLFFALLHGDPLGAFAFGIAMCVLYMRSQSLLLPIACHALNNLAVLLIELGYVAVDGPGQTYTLERFRDEWIIGALCGLVCLLWANRYLRRGPSDVRWRLPTGRTGVDGAAKC